MNLFNIPRSQKSLYKRRGKPKDVITPQVKLVDVEIKKEILKDSK